LTDDVTSVVLRAFSCFLQASKGATQHDEIQLGLFYAILTEPKLAARVSPFFSCSFVLCE